MGRLRGLRFALGVCAAAACATPAASARACEAAAIVAPASQSTVQAAQPWLQWRAVAGASAYRVRIATRVPEGRAIERIDTRTGQPAFTLTSGLGGEPRVKVSVEVEAECGTQIAPASALEFVWETPAVCALTGDVLAHYQISADRTGGVLRWSGLSQGSGVEVCVTARDGVARCVRPVAAQIALSPEQHPPLLASIAPLCAGVAGRPRHIAVPAVSPTRQQ